MSIAKDLEKLLSRERALLLAGDYEGLHALIEKKMELEGRLADTKPNLPIEDCVRLSEMAKHNEALLASAQRGLQSAIAQLKQLADGETQKTYSKDGQRTSLSRKPTSVAQKV